MKKDTYEYPLGTSVTCIAVTLVLSYLFKWLTENIIEDLFFRRLMNEVIATTELCICSFELVIVNAAYGSYTYCAFHFLLKIWFNKNWGPNTTACPYMLIEKMHRRTDYREILLLTWAQLLGSALSCHYVLFYWSLYLIPIHYGRATRTYSVHFGVAAVIEYFCTLIYRFLMTLIWYKKTTKYKNVMDAAILTSLVIIAYPYSGGYMNPIEASALQNFSENLKQHICIYWIAPYLGAITVMKFCREPRTQRMFRKIKLF